MSIKNYMTQDHRDCDDEFAPFEEAVGAEDWDKANTIFPVFHDAMLKHFNMEEKVLFPQIEAKMGTDQGPTAIMRMEHDQMKNVMFEMEGALNEKNTERLLGLGESFMILVQQHNMKEEQIVYGMARNFFIGEVADTLLEDMKKQSA